MRPVLGFSNGREVSLFGVAAYLHRPDVFVLGLVELVEAHAGIGRVKLQVEHHRLDRLLLVADQTGEAVGARCRRLYAAFHQLTFRPNTVHTPSVSGQRLHRKA